SESIALSLKGVPGESSGSCSHSLFRLILNIDNGGMADSVFEMNRKPGSSQDVAHEELQMHLEKSGLRMTVQRQHVYGVLLQKKDHPTAEEVFIRAKKGM